MGKIDKILVPLDGSKNSLRGLDMAIAIAKQSDAEIVGTYTIYEPLHSEFRGVADTKKAVNVEVKKILENAKKMALQKGVRFRKKILHGDIGDNLVKFAHNKKEKFNMIVIGSRGRSSLKEMFLGSTSNYVLHSSKIPVLIVK